MNLRTAFVKVCPVVGLVLLMLIFVPTAFAGKTWCSTDPIVKINGVVVNIVADIEGADASAFTKETPLEFTLEVPKGTEVEVLYLDREPYETLRIRYTHKKNHMVAKLEVPEEVEITSVRLTVSYQGQSFVAFSKKHKVKVKAPLP